MTSNSDEHDTPPEVVALAAGGDAAALEILDRGASLLAEMVLANHLKLPTGPGPEVVITGGGGSAALRVSRKPTARAKDNNKPGTYLIKRLTQQFNNARSTLWCQVLLKLSDAAAGVKVTLVESRPRLLEFIDDEIAESLQFRDQAVEHAIQVKCQFLRAAVRSELVGQNFGKLGEAGKHPYHAQISG